MIRARRVAQGAVAGERGRCRDADCLGGRGESWSVLYW